MIPLKLTGVGTAWPGRQPLRRDA